MPVVKLFCGFSEISNGISYFRKSSWDKGKELYKAGHVDQVVETRGMECGIINITGKCMSQVKKSDIYSININVST